MKHTRVYLCMLSFILVFFLFGAARAAIEGISFYVPFEDNATPTIAGGESEPVADNIGEYIEGKRGKAAVTNIDNWVQYQAQDNINAQEGTIAMWINPMDWNAHDGFFHFFFEAKGTEEAPGWLLIYKHWASTQLKFLGGIGGQAGEYVGVFTDFSKWKPGEWHFIACSWQSRKLTLYVDGEQKYVNGQQKPETSIEDEIYPRSFSSILIGGHRQWRVGGEQNKTAIDELYIYNRALSPGEIESLYLQEGKITFFPSINSLAVEMVMDSKITPKLRLLVTDSFGEVVFEKVFQEDEFILRNDNSFIIRRAVELPVLNDGIYTTWLETPSDEKNFSKRNFEVKDYEWEDNALGKSETIIPPFTPLKTEGKIVEAILREHHLGDLCLWEQVKSLGEPILAEPISLKVAKAGQVIPWKEVKLPEIIEAKPNQVKAIAIARNDILSVKSYAQFDYDGLMKLDLHIIPLKHEPVDRIWLEIPVEENVATLFHAVGEWIRANPGGEIPKTEGLVFESRSIPQPHIDNFIPYIWIGGEERGICWAADWDKDWIHSEHRSAVELFREKNKVVIKVNFINGPVILNRERMIEFALQASPVKPLPPEWREMTFDFQTPGRMRFPLLWPPSWGAHYGWASRYPLDHDFSIIHKLNETKKTGERDNEFIDRWVEKVMTHPGPIDFRETEEYVSDHVEFGFRCAKNLYNREPPGKLIYYSCASPSDTNLLPENIIYNDEWQFEDRRVHSSKSFQDYAVWYADKMMEAAMDGIYVDVTFLWARTAWPIGEGYIDDDGEVHPSLGIWRIRSLIKRLAVMMYEKGKEPFIFVHKTNTNLLPTVSFAKAILGWEWKCESKLPYQERFTPDYVRAVNLPFQTGNISIVIAKNVEVERDSPESIRLTRTALALALPHEIFLYHYEGSHTPTSVKARDIISNFRQNKLNIKSYPYWQKNNPVKTTANLLITAYQDMNKLLLVVGNMGNETIAEIKFDLKELGYARVEEALNLETEESIFTFDTGIELNIQEYDFALIEVKFSAANKMSLPSGWSLISLPVIPDPTTLSSVFPDAVVVYGYEKGRGYVRVKPEEVLEAGRGYWILLNKAQTFTLTGKPIQGYPLSVENGWYMIGGCSSTAQASVDNGNITVIYGYVPGSGYQRVLEPENLEPGRGYWILLEDVSDQACLNVVVRGD